MGVSKINHTSSSENLGNDSKQVSTQSSSPIDPFALGNCALFWKPNKGLSHDFHSLEMAEKRKYGMNLRNLSSVMFSPDKFPEGRYFLARNFHFPLNFIHELYDPIKLSQRVHMLQCGIFILVQIWNVDSGRKIDEIRGMGFHSRKWNRTKKCFIKCMFKFDFIYLFKCYYYLVRDQ